MENSEKKLDFFLQKSKKLNTRSLPGAINWYTHWSDDPPQSQVLKFLFFYFLVFFACFRGRKIRKCYFDQKNGLKKDQKIKKNQKFDPCDCGGSSDQYVYQFLALGNDLESSVFRFLEKNL